MKQLILGLLLVFTFEAIGQVDTTTTTKYAKVELNNGSIVEGELLELNDDYLLIASALGEVKIQQQNIKKLEISAEEPDLAVARKGYRNYSDAYFLLPSARPVGLGNSHYKNYNVFFNQFNLAASDMFSLGIGFESISLLAGQLLMFILI